MADFRVSSKSAIALGPVAHILPSFFSISNPLNKGSFVFRYAVFSKKSNSPGDNKGCDHESEEDFKKYHRHLQLNDFSPLIFLISILEIIPEKI